jgi:hypothetical protein
MKELKPMSSPSKKSRVLKTFNYPVKVEVRESVFEPLASIAMLDLSRLSKGSHKIEIGFVKGGCCQRPVCAVIKNGMVTNVEFEMCKGCEKPVSKELLTLIQAARREIRMPAPSKWRPIPVAEFLKSPAQMSELVISWENWCIQICISWGGALHCYYCCAWPPECGTDTIATGPLL